MSTRWGIGRLSARKDVDEVVVERLIAGSPPAEPPTYAELWAAIDALDRPGASSAYIAERLGTTQRTVTRRRAARRKEAA